MAGQLFLEAVLDEPRGTLRTFEAMAAGAAEGQCRIPATIEKEQRLLVFFECFGDRTDEALRQPFARFELLGLEVDQRHIRHRDARKASGEHGMAIASDERVDVAFDRRRRGREHDRKLAEIAAHDRHVTRSLADVQAFRKEYKDIIIKPLYGNGGAAVFRIKPDDGNLASLVELFQTVFREPFMVQEFRPEVKDGDKRIILVDGEVAGALNRVPQAGETRSNLHVGGTAVASKLTKRDEEICARLKPELKKRGLIFTGIDVIGPYLTEINVTSPTGIRQIKAFGGNDIAAMIWDVIEKKRAHAA